MLNTKTTNSQRLKRYKAKMKAHGYKRLSFWAHGELDRLLKEARKPNECIGRTLERLLLGQAMKRPPTTYTRQNMCGKYDAR